MSLPNNVKISLFGIRIDVMDQATAVNACRALMQTENGPCRYVVTPNVDHVITLHRNSRFRAAYNAASLILADGNPIVWASRLMGTPLPGTVTGSDLVPSVLRSAGVAEEELSVFLLGAGPGVAEKAAANIESTMSFVRVAGVYSPPFGFENNPAETENIISRINAAAPQLLIIGLGAPKQEIWIHSYADRVQAKLAICAGAVIDFMADEKPRAPAWMQRYALEWLHRLLSEPRRLAARYAKGAIIFPYLLLKEYIRRRK